MVLAFDRILHDNQHLKLDNKELKSEVQKLKSDLDLMQTNILAGLEAKVEELEERLERRASEFLPSI